MYVVDHLSARSNPSANEIHAVVKTVLGHRTYVYWITSQTVLLENAVIKIM